MTAPLPPALDYLIGQLETTAAECAKSPDAPLKYGRGEGLRIAKSMLDKAWPAILAQADLPSSVEAERLRSALRNVSWSLRTDAKRLEPLAESAESTHAGDVNGALAVGRMDAFHDAAWRIDSAIANPAQPSELWAGFMDLLRWLEHAPDAGANAKHRRVIRTETARRLREMLGLPPKEDR